MQTSHQPGRYRIYLEGLKAATSGNAQAFGFSILISVSYGIVSAAESDPSIADQVGFALSAVAAFSLLNVLVAWLARREPVAIRSRAVLLVATATDFLAVGAGLGVVIGGTVIFTGLADWIVSPFVGAAVYLLVQAIELALGHEADQS